MDATASVSFRMDAKLKKILSPSSKWWDSTWQQHSPFLLSKSSMKGGFRLQLRPIRFSVPRIRRDCVRALLNCGIRQGQWARSDWGRQQDDRKKLTKVNALIKDIKRNGNSGLGLPEPLTGNLSGLWSRRIDAKNRLIYRISEEDGNRTLEIVQCRTHYNDK